MARCLLLLAVFLTGIAARADDEINYSNLGALAPLAVPVQKKAPEAEIQTTQSSRQCSRVAIGKSAIVNQGYGINPSPSGVEAKYRLSHPIDSKYVADLKIFFEAGQSYDAAIPKSMVNVAYQKKVSECLADLTSKLKGPDGKTLEIRLSNDPEIPVNLVKIVSSKARSNSHEYRSDASCAVITHEVFHLMGLADEYHEMGGEMGDEHDVYKCRAFGPYDSIMNSHEDAAYLAAVTEHYSIEECMCPPSLDCREVAKTSDGKNCPDGTAWKKSERIGKESTRKEVPNLYSFVLTHVEKELVGVASYGGNLLYPAHFRAITQPGCTDVNSVYYACASQAYLMPEGNGCPARPDVCSGLESEWLK